MKSVKQIEGEVSNSRQTCSKAGNQSLQFHFADKPPNFILGCTSSANWLLHSTSGTFAVSVFDQQYIIE